MKLTLDEIEAGKSQRGGWTRTTLAGWGVPWPPPKGWKDQLLAGTAPAPSPASLEAHLLREVVMAVIDAGQNDILKGLEGLNAYYGSSLPTVADIVGGRPKTAIIEGGITWEDKVYRFSVARTIGESGQ
jgi:hypothetical protein